MTFSLYDLLQSIKRPVETIRPDTTIADAVHAMNQAKIGSLVVMDNERMVGIFTERDVLVRVVDAGLNPKVTRVSQAMTPHPHHVNPDVSLEEAMKIITDTRCRHLPVLDSEEKLLGIVSIGDLMRWIVYDKEHQITDLMHYITDTGALEEKVNG